MTPIVAAGLGLSILAGFGAPGGNLAPRVGTFGKVPVAPAPQYPSPYQQPDARYTTPRYTPGFPTAPQPPSMPTMGQPELFTPYNPKSVYSNRGGIDSYPAPRKPPGYIDLR